ncbi:nucleotidyltransferase family protein [Kordiimonas sp.]|uniref:nucleotidyltransferase family protein n=1 Tax=Kordiimonas sp. TaxID=1970157 RepID=UPI003A8EAD51
MRAIVLSAGLGTRMGAMSQITPKPLVPVLGQPLLDHTFAKLDALGVGPVVVNVHHLADKIEEHLSARIRDGRVLISDERAALLDTGGGVKKVLPLLGADPFFAINSDALWLDGARPTLARLQEAFDPSVMDVLLLLVRTEHAHGYDGPGDFIPQLPLEDVTPVEFRGEALSAPVMFGGIQVVAPEMYEGMPEGTWSNREIFRKAAARGRLYGMVHDGRWFHVGTPEAVSEAEAEISKARAR